MHREQSLYNIKPIGLGMKVFGRVFTVRTYPGDWSKPVEAVDLAEKGDVIIIDAGGVGPAVWGELATHGAMQKKIGGVIINGGLRDTEEIRRSKFPAFTKLVCPNAGEPKGFGEVNIPINIEGRRIFPGDWVIGDDDGVIIIPKVNIVETANRAMSILETEMRLRGEIDKGSTLAQITELLRWEKK